MEFAELTRIWLQRLTLIVLLGMFCGAGAGLLALGDARTYAQELTFVVRPSDRLPIIESDRVASTLSDRDSAIMQSVVGLLDSSRLRPAPRLDAVERTTTLRPGSNIVDVRFRGADSAAITRVAQAYSLAAPQAVSDSYPIFELEPLGGDDRPVAEPSSLPRTIVIGAAIGVALGLAVAAVEARLLGRPPGPPPVAAEPDPDRVRVIQHDRTRARGSGPEP
jgi:hypothetical protein